MLIGNQSESTIREMESMGFGRPEIERALRAAYGNPDRAIEYLLTGIPAHIQAEQRQGAQGGGGGQAAAPAAAAGGNTPAPAAAPAATGEEEVDLFQAAAAAQGGNRGGAGQRGAAGTGGAAAGLAGATGAGGEVDMNFLRNSPQFQQIRQIVQQQPAMLEPILQQVAEGNPQLAQMIGQNQEQFLQLLAEQDDGEGPLPPGTHQITVTPEERDAIERLVQLGFSRDRVIQAYFVCEKNEELAANYLFEQPEDDDDPPTTSGP
jgi:UV excision repair protein RAD23